MKYKTLLEHYESCLDRHGDSHRGVDWPNLQDAEVRYDVMINLVPPREINFSLLDFGCGAGHLLEYLRRTTRRDFRYAGADLSLKFISLCKAKFPHENFFTIDLLNKEMPEKFDYIIANGVFTEKMGLSFEEMFKWFCGMLEKLFLSCNKGIAFNIMSPHVDWKRDDLFHLPLDLLAGFLGQKLSRHFVIRQDYGLYEYTVYLYREPRYETSYSQRK